MEKTVRFSISIFVILSFMLLVLSGCGSDSTPTTFTAGKVSGKTFAYTSASGSTGSLAFNADGTWRTTGASSAFSGTWSINPAGKLVCVTTTGGNHTITYTLLDESASALNVSASEVNPSDPAKPASSYTATFATAFTVEMLAGKTITYSSSTGSTGTIKFGHDGTWQTTTGTSVFTGTWSIKNGALVCVTTSGGNHTITYTRTDTTDNPMAA
ncbi:MAG: hypothetical protein HIU83_11880, partial [Proteobacteria bacterium]|nr:hypothetical protein [Pseudomonadota bacterium]